MCARSILNLLLNMLLSIHQFFKGSLSASFRLRGEDDVILPPGFRFCYKSENAACDHARACMADGMGRKSCV
ncbi:unnamed protein product [Angiostrongylus costaricensis]|uniref:Secreted protein n=1 Tax=Angiostrongylus costaricensis TaxID=334426 RepID=A0A0R3PGZ4_ANGCS|nr:unnamed protein product [Angiostrongylus costaricensis]